MRFSVCIEMFFPECAHEARLEPIGQAGFDTIEFWSPYDKDLNALGKEAARLGLQVALFSGHRRHSPVLAEDRNGFLEELQRNAATARALGCPRLMVLSDALEPDGAAKPARLSDAQKRKHLERALSEAAALAAREGVQLLLEPLNLRDHPNYFLHRSADAFELVRAVGSPHLKVLYDVYHMQRAEGHLLETIEAQLPQIGHFHVAEVPGRVEPGDGEIHHANLFARLKAWGFMGVVGFECRPQRDDATALGRIQHLIQPFATQPERGMR